MSKKYETIDEQLDRKFAKKQEKKEKRGAITRIVAAVLAFAATIGLSIFLIKKNHNKNNENVKSNTNITKEVDNTEDTKQTLYDEKSVGIRKLGKELELPTKENSNKPKYGETVTGNVDINEIVEKNNTIWKDQTAADNSNNVGKAVVDTNHITNSDGTVKDTTLVVDGNGDVKVSEQGYEIVDENDTIIDSGNSDIPVGYAWDDVIGGYVPVEEVGKYVKADKDYWGYDNNGKAYIVIYKDEVILKSQLENAKATLYTTKPEDINVVGSETIAPETEAPEEVINENGTYTVYGLTFETKEDYEQWVIQGFEGYVLIDGIMEPETEELQMQKVLN